MTTAVDQPGFDPRAGLWALDALPAEAAPERCLVCELGGMRLAVPIAFLRGVEAFNAYTALPKMPNWVVGVTNVRGTVVGVVDLARFFGVGEVLPGRGRLLVCGSGPHLVALAVGSTPSVVDFTPTSLVDARGVAGRVGRYIAGLLPVEGVMTPLLDVGQLLAQGELVNG